MRKLSIFLLATLLVSGLIFVWGCSDDDDNGTDSTALPDGDPLDAVFMAAEEPLDSATSLVQMAIVPMVEAMSYLMDSSEAVAKPLDIAQPDTLWYDEANHYWHAQDSDFEGGYPIYTRDSVQFWHGANAVKWPDSALLTGIKGGGNRLATIITAKKPQVSDTASYFDYVIDIESEPGDLAGFGDVTINGSGSIYLYSMQVKSPSELYCSYEIDDNFQVNNVQLNMSQVFEMEDCPDAGNTMHFADLTLDCTGDSTFSHTDNWYVRETFTGDSIKYVVENSDFHWEFSESCE